MAEMNTMIAWNTGCHYTSAGQRMAACVDTYGTVHFIDIDRSIWGSLDARYTGLIMNFDPEWVHREYLHNRYHESCPAGDLYRTLRDAALQVKPLDEV